MQAYCPNCRAPVAAEATSCAACQAVFAPDGWGPVDAAGAYVTPRATPPASAPGQPVDALLLWLRVTTFYPLLVILGGAYGAATHRAFSALFSSQGGKSGLMMLSFLGGVPLLLCAAFVYVVLTVRKIPLAQALSVSGLGIMLFVFLAGTVLREGVICIVMAMPLFLLVGLVGGLIGWAVASAAASREVKKRSLCLALFVPLLFGAVEDRIVPPDLLVHTRRSVHIAAPAPAIWRLVNYPVGIRPDELAGGFAYRIGVPYPIEARTLEERVGGRRQLVWQRGVRFEEEITEFAVDRRIAWKYLFSPQSFPAGSLDEHVTIGGLYFTLVDTAYTLTPEAGGTRLEIDVTSRVSTTFNWYAGTWAGFLIGDTAEAILGFYKRRAEQGAPTSKATAGSQRDVHATERLRTAGG